MDEEDAEIIQEFLIESSETLDELDRELVELEKDPDNASRLAAVFRAAHTIKGTSGLLGFQRLESVTHVGENVLAKLRDGKLTLTPDLTSVLLRMVDAIRAMLATVEQRGDDGDDTHAELIADLELVLCGGRGAPRSPSVAPVVAIASSRPVAPAVEPSAAPRSLDGSEGRSASTAQLEPRHPAALSSAGDSPEVPSPDADPADAGKQDASVRVHVDLLDQLMNLVGELVLSRNQILQSAGVTKDGALAAASQRLNLITTELQEGVMKTRMQPIGSVWSKFPRIVRDLAMACGKRVKLELAGRETELDRTIVEAIRDPLTHIMRNSVDHGLEAPEERLALGKPETGTVTFRAFHEGGMVNIEVTDDGRGVDAAAVRSKAVERGLLSEQAAAKLSDREAIALVFEPGFSTAKKVSNVSGRGVGMDVVKTSIERIGGTVDIQSRAGEGTSIRVKIPLTLAIIPALVVASGDDRYAIPQVSLVELVRVSAEDGADGIEYIRDAPVYRLRGRLLPLVFLWQVLGGQRDSLRDASDLNIVVLQADGRLFGLVVDGVEDTQEIVVKPLGSELKSIPVFAGATIMGDGRIALILDAFGIAGTVGMAATEGEGAALAGEEHYAGDSTSLLTFEALSRQRMALPLAEVARLEEVDSARVERVGERHMLQYRGAILPLFFVEDLVGDAAPTVDQETLQIIVVTQQAQTFGILVRHILDVVEQRGEVQTDMRRAGVVGCAVLHGRVTEILDAKLAGARLLAEPGSEESPKLEGTEAA